MLKRAVWFGAALVVLLLSVPVMTSGCQGTCTKTSECGKDEYCSIANGTCLTPKSLGFCKARPTECAAVAHPVCGCDGKQYTNSCDAAMKGASIASDGPCEGVGSSCGGVDAVKCAAGQYCNFDPGACAESAPSGACTTVPTTCPDFVPSPVCGCDGKTYDSACKASQALMPILAEGECQCDATHPCEEERFCSFPNGTCLLGNPTGTCKLKPTECSPVAGTVCGCDGVTYASTCLASQAGASVAGMGNCALIPDGGTPTDVVLLISEVRTQGKDGDMFGDEFIEIFNPNDTAVLLDDTWEVWHQSAQGVCGQEEQLRYVGTGKTIPPYGHFLLGGLQYQQNPPVDNTMINTNENVSLADAGSVDIRHNGVTVDAVCYFFDPVDKNHVLDCMRGKPYHCEGKPISNLPHTGTTGPDSSVDASFERKLGGLMGNYQDTGDNEADFQTTMPSTPMNLASRPTPPPPDAGAPDAGDDAGDGG